ncbi:hypothetical protein O9G_006294 [Rozella allomycis CSF55]|uniref:RGS domain-containing protein n=1 Tax=Rozella allomycis (strain CSF55) TaxID=988480 RepID=A0A075AS56_ROZAC|nr:hypothetical protein O9G_006294 [Rozella allomycis CSF55]|eukprot:EPZ31393.1 hypothetical protein O9G_006294 [Rozella allomycis CSF55]
MQSTPLPSIREEYVDQGRVLTDSIIEINIRRKPSLAEITNVDMIFDDPILLERFRDFTVLDFSVENLCFYEEYRDFKHALTLFNVDPGSNQNRQSLAEPNDEEITNPEIIQMILNIYSEYIMNGSPSELNLTEFARLGVSNYFASIFDNVAGEILRLMNGCSLMRFIAMEKEGKRFETS